MTVNEILNMSPLEVSRMTDKQLRQAVSVLGSAANKRLKRAQEKETLSPAVRGLLRSGGRITTSDKKSINAVRAEFMRAKDFLNAKTSTAAGFKKSTQEFAERIGVDEIRKEQANAFWDIYSRIKDQNPFIVQMVGTNGVQKMIGDYMSDDGNIRPDAVTEEGKDAIVNQLLAYGEQQYEEFQADYADWASELEESNEYLEMDWEDMEDEEY